MPFGDDVAGTARGNQFLPSALIRRRAASTLATPAIHAPGRSIWAQCRAELSPQGAEKLPKSVTMGAAPRTEQIGGSYLAVPDGSGPYPGIVVIHEVFGLNDNIRDICRRFAEHDYAALGVNLFAGRNRALCIARVFIDWMAGVLDDFAVADLKAAFDDLAARPEVDRDRIGVAGFCLGGTIAMTWACVDDRLKAVAPWYGSAPKRKQALRRLCPLVGSWPDRDFTTGSVKVLEAELSAASIPHDLKVYPGTKHAFFNDRLHSYHAAAAADSWERVLAFFGEHLRDLATI